MMNIFMSAKKNKPTINVETIDSDGIKLKIYFEDLYTHSGDVFKCILELIGPSKYMGNIKIDYIVIYIYGIYILNNNILNVCSPYCLNKQISINTPFYNKNDLTNKQKYLLFYSDPILLCSDFQFENSNETFYYSFECCLPSFTPPSYNGKNIKIKYYMYIQSIKRLFMNRTEAVTKINEGNIPITVKASKYNSSYINSHNNNKTYLLPFLYYPIKPYNIKLINKTNDDFLFTHKYQYIHESNQNNQKKQKYEYDKTNKQYEKNIKYKYIYHNFRMKITNIFNKNVVVDTSEKSKQNDVIAKKNDTIYMNNNTQISFKHSSIPSYIYNNIYKSNIDILVCMYNICNKKKDQSTSLFMLNYIVNNYNYFYYLHTFLFLIYHYYYYKNVIQKNIIVPSENKNLTIDLYLKIIKKINNYKNGNFFNNTNDSLYDEKFGNDRSQSQLLLPSSLCKFINEGIVCLNSNSKVPVLVKNENGTNGTNEKNGTNGTNEKNGTNGT
ncbi:conserved protein, unknown function, partial [Hepatocystis sp. ex Piliocolobus tephrosceles]